MSGVWLSRLGNSLRTTGREMAKEVGKNLPDLLTPEVRENLRDQFLGKPSNQKPDPNNTDWDNLFPPPPPVPSFRTTNSHTGAPYVPPRSRVPLSEFGVAFQSKEMAPTTPSTLRALQIDRYNVYCFGGGVGIGVGIGVTIGYIIWGRGGN